MTIRKVRYDSGENIVEVKIKDETRREIENWKLMLSDLPEWFNIMKNKYGLKLKKRNTDLDWAIK